MAAQQATSLHLRQLAQISVLQKVAVDKEKLFIHPNLLRLLTQDEALPIHIPAKHE